MSNSKLSAIAPTSWPSFEEAKGNYTFKELWELGHSLTRPASPSHERNSVIEECAAVGKRIADRCDASADMGDENHDRYHFWGGGAREVEKAIRAMRTNPPTEERRAAWVDGICKTCGQYTHSCQCAHPAGVEAFKKLFAAPREGAGSPAGPAQNGEPSRAAPSTQAFTATHEHADGGLYERLDFGQVRMGADWEPAVFYKSSDGKLYATNMLRWNARFMPCATSATALKGKP